MAEGPSALPHLHDELAPTTDAAWTSPDDTVLTMSRALRRLARRLVAQAVTPQLRLAGLLDELAAPLAAPDHVQPFIEDELLALTLAPEPAAFEPSATTATTTITPRQRRRAEEPAPRRW
jgi:hypothetical protein